MVWFNSSHPLEKKMSMQSAEIGLWLQYRVKKYNWNQFSRYCIFRPVAEKKKNNNYWSCIISMTWPDTDIFITHWVFKALELKLHNFSVNHWFIETEHLRVCVCDFLTSQCVLPRCSQRSSLVPGHRHTGPQSGMQPTWWERDTHTHACHVWLSLRPTAVESHCCSWMADCFI